MWLLRRLLLPLLELLLLEQLHQQLELLRQWLQLLRLALQVQHRRLHCPAQQLQEQQPQQQQVQQLRLQVLLELLQLVQQVQVLQLLVLVSCSFSKHVASSFLRLELQQLGLQGQLHQAAVHWLVAVVDWQQEAHRWQLEHWQVVHRLQVLRWLQQQHWQELHCLLSPCCRRVGSWRGDCPTYVCIS